MEKRAWVDSLWKFRGRWYDYDSIRNNKGEIRVLSLAGALYFDNTVYRSEALWQSELAIRSQGELFDHLEIQRSRGS
ncbi:MAG: hypothetical protein KF756_08215 [Acidobacteria bacterium]|nr:hypothetical protein [Acidobacteriota bacterium]